MEVACKDRVRTAGAEQQRDDNTVNKQNEFTLCVPKLKPYSKDEEVVSGGFSDVCCMCGVRFALLDHQPEHFIKHTDEVCCHLCQMKFSHTNSLALHLKNDHPKYRMFCKSCGMSMGLRKLTVEPDESPKKEFLDEAVEEVIIKNEEVEIKCVKEEEEEVVVGGAEETEENGITENAENKKMVNMNLLDHTYCSTQTCSSIRETTNNVVMYTTRENVLVFVNKTGTTVSPKDSYTESDQQGTPVDDQTVCPGIHDHTYFSIQNLAKQVSAHNTRSFFCKTASNVMNSSTENVQVFNNLVATRISPKYLDSPGSEQDQIQNHEMMCRVLLDHAYVRQIFKNHTVLLKEIPSPNTCRSNTDKANKENLPENRNPRNNAIMTDRETTQCSSAAMLESSQLESNIKVEEDLGVFKPIQEDVVIREYEESLHRSDNENNDSLPMDDSVYTSQNDLYSHTASCTSTDNTADTLEEGCKIKRLSACPKQNCENTNQKPLRSVDSVNSNHLNSLYKNPRIRNCGDLSKVSNADESVGQSTRKQTSFTCSLCEIVFSTEEMLLNHQAEKHPLAKYVCVRCLQLFPNQKIFIQHVCSKSKEFSVESLTPSTCSNNAKEPLYMILNLVPSTAAADSSKQPLSSQSVSSINTAQNLGNVSKSTSHSLSKDRSTSATQKIPVQVATRSSSCAPKKKATCLVLNGDQGQLTSPISTVAQNQIGQVQVLSPLQAKVVTETSSSTTTTTTTIMFTATTTTTTTTTTTATQIPLSSQGQEQMTPISIPVRVATRSSSRAQKRKATCLVLNGDQGQLTSPISAVTQDQIGQVQVLNPLQAKVLTQTSTTTTTTTTSTATATTTTSATQILLSSQGQGQMTPISTVTQTKSAQMHNLTPLQTKVVTHTPTGSAELTKSIVLPQQHPSFGVPLPHHFLSHVSSSESVLSQTGQLPESSVPFLDICKSPLSTQIIPSTKGPLKIVAMFVNRSKELSLQKRMHQSWRSKAVFPCRQCGAVSRQFSLGVRHRYQHRGPRLYRCHCGRAFQQRMHLLRHQVKHAEATRYVCAACGQMFYGTQQLACHRPLFRITSSNMKKQANKECRNIFQCYCGHSFTRPAALLWHMLKNSKARKPRLKGFRLA